MPLPNHCANCDKPILDSKDGRFMCENCKDWNWFSKLKEEDDA